MQINLLQVDNAWNTPNQLTLSLAVQHTAGPQLLSTPIPEQTKSGGRCQCPALREAYITYLRAGGKRFPKGQNLIEWFLQCC